MRAMANSHVHASHIQWCVFECVSTTASLVPRPFKGEEKGLGILYSRMRQPFYSDVHKILYTYPYHILTSEMVHMPKKYG